MSVDRIRWSRGGRLRRLLALVVGVTVAGLGLAPAAAAGSVESGSAQDQVLTWTADDSTTEYASFPTEAVAGPATIVFENSEATGNTTGMQHTVTFDTSTEGYNHDVDVDILATPDDENNGRHEVETVLTEGTYLIVCTIPGHGQMRTELVVTDDDDGGGGDDTTPPEVAATVEGETDDDGAYVGSATVSLNASDDSSGVDSVEYALNGGDWTAYTEPVEVAEVGEHTVRYRATDVAGNVSEPGEQAFAVVQAPGDDDEPPQVSAEVTGNQNGAWEYVESASVTITATDEGSGLESVEYALDGGDWTAYEEPLEVDDTGDHAVEYRATDAAGNVSDVASVAFTVVPDSSAPQCAEPDPSPTVVVGTVGTDVLNRDAAGQCTIDDLILDEARWSSHEGFLAHVDTVLAGLLDDGIVSDTERDTIRDAAERSDVGH